MLQTCYININNANLPLYQILKVVYKTEICWIWKLLENCILIIISNKQVWDDLSFVRQGISVLKVTISNWNCCNTQAGCEFKWSLRYRDPMRGKNISPTLLHPTSVWSFDKKHNRINLYSYLVYNKRSLYHLNVSATIKT